MKQAPVRERQLPEIVDQRPALRDHHLPVFKISYSFYAADIDPRRPRDMGHQFINRKLSFADDDVVDAALQKRQGGT